MWSLRGKGRTALGMADGGCRAKAQSTAEQETETSQKIGLGASGLSISATAQSPREVKLASFSVHALPTHGPLCSIRSDCPPCPPPWRPSATKSRSTSRIAAAVDALPGHDLTPVQTLRQLLPQVVQREYGRETESHSCILTRRQSSCEASPHRTSASPCLSSTRSVYRYAIHHAARGGWFAGLMARQKALSERGIDKMLKEVRDDNKENDAAHMKPVSGPWLLLCSPKLIHGEDSIERGTWLWYRFGCMSR